MLDKHHLSLLPGPALTSSPCLYEEEPARHEPLLINPASRPAAGNHQKPSRPC
jgi:hypothetical protein